MVAGAKDLVHELEYPSENGRFALQSSLQLIILAVRSQGVVAIDRLYNRYKDEAGLRAQYELGVALGFDGKSSIDPAQLKVINDVL